MSRGIVGGGSPEGEVMGISSQCSGAVMGNRGVSVLSGSGGGGKMRTIPKLGGAGEALRDSGIEQAGSGQPATVQAIWHQKAMDAVLELSWADSAFTAEDVRQIAGEPPTPNSLGMILRRAYKQGWIRPAGVGVASRPSRHASLIRYWTGV